MRLVLAALSFLCLALPASAQQGYSVVDSGFSDAGSAHRGVVPVQKDGVWGLIGHDGAWVVPLGMQAVGASGGGMFAVKKGGKWGLVDTTGRFVLDFQFDAIGTPSDLTPVFWKGKWWLLDTDEQFQDQPLALETLTGNDGDCFAGMAGGVATIESRSLQAQVVQPTGVTKIGAVSEEFVQVTLNGAKTHLSCTFGEPNGSNALWDETRALHEGLAAVRTGDLWGFQATSNLTLEIPQTYSGARDFSEGLAPVQSADGLWGYINKRGRMVIAPRFNAAFGFSDGLAGVTLGDKRGFITYDGTFAVQPVFDDFWRHDGGVAAVKQGESWVVIAPDITSPATRFNLPLARLTTALKLRLPPIVVTPSSPHAYSAQDIVSLHTISFTPDQSVMVTALAAYEVQEFALWDFAAKKLIRKVAFDGLTTAVLLPGTEIVAVGTASGEMALVDAVTGNTLYRFHAHDTAVMDLVLSTDGSKLAAIAQGAVRVWDLATGVQAFAHDIRAEKAQFATDSASLYVGGARGALVRLGLDGAVLAKVQAARTTDDDNAEWANQKSRPDIALSPSGILAVMRTDRIQGGDGFYSFVPWVEITDTTGRRRVELPDGLSDVLTIDLSSDGRQLAYAGATRDEFVATMGVIDLASGTPIMQRALSREAVAGEGLETGLYWVDKLAFVPGTTDLIVIGGEGGDIWQMDTAENRVAHVIGRRIAASQPLVMPGGNRVFGVDGLGHLAVWDMAQGRLEARLDDPVKAGPEGTFVTDGKRLILIDGYDETRFAMWDATTLAPLNTGPTLDIDPYAIETPQPSDDVKALLVRLGQPQYAPMLVFDSGRRAVITDTAGVGRVYALPGGELLVTFLSDPNGEWLVLTPEGFFAASEGGAKLVSISNGLHSFAVDQVYQALYRPDLVAAKLQGDPDGTLAAAAASLDLTVILGSGAAPQTRFSFPREGATAADEVIEVGIEVLDEGGGVGRIEWRVNGVTVEVQARGSAALDAGGDVAKAMIGLDPGLNQIEVIAYNAAGLVASAPRSLTVNWDGVASLVPPTLHVMAVGVNDYADGRLTLKYAAADARAFGDAIARAGAGVFGAVDLVTLLDGDVTDAGLDAAFQAMAERVKPQDVFVFFLAGHGKTVDGVYHFIPADFSFAGDDPVRTGGIAQDRWQEWMATIKARKSVMIYDTCESGSVTDTRSVDAALAQSAAVQRLTRAMGRTVLSASTDDAPALEGYKGHGVLTYALLQALGEADTNGNATIEVTELAGFLDRVVPEISQTAFNFRQVPQMSLKGSDFALGAAVNVLGDAPETFPATLTHVIAGGTEVLDAPGGAVVRKIDAGAFFGVFLIEERGGFARVAKDGMALGSVPLASLGRLQ